MLGHEEIQHIHDLDPHKSTKRKKTSMASHFDHFCERYYSKEKPSLSLRTIKYEDITDDLVGKFATYLVDKATICLQEDGQPLKWLTI